MSLRASETTEAIEYEIEINEIAALSRHGGIARNDNSGLRHRLLGRRGRTPTMIHHE